MSPGKIKTIIYVSTSILVLILLINAGVVSLLGDLKYKIHKKTFSVSLYDSLNIVQLLKKQFNLTG